MDKETAKPKILVVIDRMSGSKYHRLLLPYSRLGAIFVTSQDFLHALSFKYDYVVINNNINIDYKMMQRLKIRLGFKLVVDLDDSWDFPLYHPNYKKLIEELPNAIGLAECADIITTATPAISNSLYKGYYNKRVFSPNYLPYEGQFEIISEEKLKHQLSGKTLRVGILGSESHIVDYKEIFKQIKQIANIKDVDLIMCGFSPESDVRLLLRHVNVKEWHYPRDTESYMGLYELADIFLCPLSSKEEDNSKWFNTFKSSLKIAESISKGRILVLDELYGRKIDLEGIPFKILKNDLYVEKEDWYKAVVDLLYLKKTGELLEMSLEKRKEAEDKLDTLKLLFTNRVNELGNALYYAKNIEVKELPSLPERQFQTLTNTKLELRTIVYDDSQIEYAQFQVYKNYGINSVEKKSYLFEHNVMISLVEESDPNTYVGLFSHKFADKTGISTNTILNFMSSHLESPVFTFCPTLHLPYIKHTEVNHKGFTELFKEVLENVRFGEETYGKFIHKLDKIPTIYSSFFIAKKSIYYDFIETLLKPAIEYMERKENMARFMVDSGYIGLHKDTLKKYTGLDHYPMITFIVERLFSVYCLAHDLDIREYFKLNK
jgi:hypothetical protein